MKGFIAKVKGIPINEVAIVATTIKEKLRREELEKFKSNIRDCLKQSKDAFLLEVGDVVDGAWRVEGRMNTSHCPYGVPTTKLSRMQDVYAFLGKILVESTNKIEYLEREKLKIEEKIIHMCFHMHVLKIAIQEE